MIHNMHFNIRCTFVLLLFSSLLKVGAQNDGLAGAYITVDPKLGKVIHHELASNQTIYSIARQYGIEESRILEANPGSSRNHLPSQVLIPIDNEDIVLRLPIFRNKEKYLPLYYQVRKKDNVFRISRVYFDMPTNLLENRNNLTEAKLSIGQSLQIGWLKRSFDELIVNSGSLFTGKELPPESELSKKYQERFEQEYVGLTLIPKNEVAHWKESETTKGIFVMHRHARQQSIIQIENPMSGVTAYAKVIGNIPEHLYPKEIDMVLSKELAVLLGAKDPKFFVRSRYKSSQASASR